MGKLLQWLPSLTLQMARTTGLKYNQVAFRVAPSLTKFEIKRCGARAPGASADPRGPAVVVKR